MNEYSRAWVGKADNDLKNAEPVLAARDWNCPYDAVCFHCQYRWFPADEALRESRDELLPPSGERADHTRRMLPKRWLIFVQSSERV